MELRPEEMEPLRLYDIMANDDDELLIQLPGCFKGDALEAKLLYNGGRHAILVRNKYQKIICDDIHPEVRNLMMKADKVLIFEVDMLREYFVEVVREDIDKVCEEAIQLHDVNFVYHPFPVIDQTFETGKAKCSFCKKETKIFLKTEHFGDEYTICPQCIDDAVPFNNGIDLNPDIEGECMAYDRYGQVFQMTPPLIDRGRPAKLWGVHCDSLGIYLGMLEPEDLNSELREELIKTWDNEFNIYKNSDPEDAFEKLANGECTCHLFRCTQCKNVFCIFFENE